MGIDKGFILMVVIFLFALCFVNFTSAEVFTFDNVKTYDAVKQEVTITNTFGIGEDIAKIKLNTPLNVITGYGGVFKVAEFEVISLKDYTTALEEIKFYNTNDLKKEIQRTYEYKIKSYETIIVNDYKETCSLLKNSTQICDSEIVGNHTELKEVWLPLGKTDFLKDDVKTIGIFTYVYKGDNVEWIPNYYGVKIDEWASWSASLDAGLYSYFAFENSGGGLVLNNITGNANGTIHNSANAKWTTGKVGQGYRFNGTIGTEINLTAIPRDSLYKLFGNQSICFWWDADIGTLDAGFLFRWAGDYLFDVEGNGSMRFVSNSAGNTKILYGTGNATASSWIHYCFIRNFDNGNMKAYQNGVNVGTISSISPPAGFNGLMYLGGSTLAGGVVKGGIDELGFWNRSLTLTEVETLYNSGNGIPYGINLQNPQIVLNSPEYYYNTTSPTIIFNITALDYNIGGGISNVSLFIDNSLNELDTSGVNGTYIFTKILSAGLHNWSILSYSINETINQSETRFINLTISSPSITLNSPINYLNTTNPYIEFNVSVTDNLKVQNVSLYIDGVFNRTNTMVCSYPFTCEYYFDNIFNEGTHYWSILSYDNESNPSQSSNRYFTIDYTPPLITAVYPATNSYTEYINYITDYLTTPWRDINLLWNTYDLNLGFCWFENITNFGVTRTNTTLPCNNNGTIVNLPFNTAYTFRFYANDSVGNFGTKEITNYKLKYKISLKNQSYTTPVIEGNNEDYFANINLDSAFSINNVIFNYNGTNSTGTYTTIGNYIRLEKLNFLVPAVSSNANNTFNFWVVLNDSSVINITTQTQQVNNLLIGSCGTYTYKLFYVNLSDEKTQNAINGTIETNVLIKNKLATTTLYNWTSSINNITTSLCSSTPLTTSTEYSVYGTIKYYASNENFTAYTEYYNFLNWSLTSLTQYQNITLYDLNTTEGIEFQLTFTDSTYRKREDILIYVYREYVPEGRFKLVELPKTDSNGQTIVHLVRNDVLYNLIAVDSEGRVLGTLNNVIAFCNDYTIGDCKINFQGTTIETQLENYFESLGLSYTLSYNEATNTISFVFSSITNDLKNMRLNVITSAVVTNRTICDTSLNAVSGTLTCDVSSVVNSSSYVYVKIFLEDEEILNEGFSLDSSDWNVKGVIFFGFLFLLIIGIMFIESKEGLIISVILGLIVLVGLGVVKGKIIGFSSGILWLIIVGIILLVKLNKEKSG